jgi:anti-sigma regulatory factor (Ser/Thr protein kinase)
VLQLIKIKIPAQLGFIPGIRTALGRISYNFGFSDKDVYEIETVIDEICSNAVIHWSSGTDEHITIDCGFDTRIIEITVKDSGSSDFDIENVLENGKKLMRDDTERKINALIERGGGLGLIIVQQYVDKVEFTTHPDGTEVKLVKIAHS